MYRWTVHLKGAPKNGTAVAVGHKVYFFGGARTSGHNDHIDVHVFNTVSLRWRNLPPVTPGRQCVLDVPPRLRSHTAVLIEDVVYLWGGRREPDSKHWKVLYAFDVDAHRWFRPETSGAVPDPRQHASACVLGKVMLIYGGHRQRRHDDTSNDLYRLDTATMVWDLINTRGALPAVSMCHSSTIIETKMFVFEGYRHQDIIRVFDTETNLWLSSPSGQLLPEGRSGVIHNGELFGGENHNFDYYHYHYYALWKFNPETFSWKKVEPKGKGPSQVYYHHSCMVRDRIVVFGGQTGVSTYTDDLHILDLRPSLKTLCKLAVILCGLEQSELQQDIRWELAAMTTNSHR